MKNLTKPWVFVYVFSFMAMGTMFMFMYFSSSASSSADRQMYMWLMLVALLISQMGVSTGNAFRAFDSRISTLESELRDLKSKLEAQDSPK